MTDKYHERYCLGISFATDTNHYYIPLNHQAIAGFEHENLQVPKDLFRNVQCPIVFHNAAFDLQVLRKEGIYVPSLNIWDTMLMSHYIDENVQGKEIGHSLESLAKRYLKDDKKVELSKTMRPIWDQVPPYIMAMYAEADAYLTRDLYYILMEYMEKEWIDQWENYDREFMLLLVDIMKRGLPIDRELCQSLESQCLARMAQIRHELGFDPAKPSQLHPKLFDDPPHGLGLIAPQLTPTGKPHVSQSYLESLGHPVAALVLEYRRIAKQTQGYYTAYLGLSSRDYARLHPNFKQHGTTTGRLSCSDPNLQQIPREEYKDSNVKEVFLPEPNKQLWEIDFSTIEYRLMAVYAQEPRLLETFRNEGDFHQMIADDLGISRFAAKTVNYAMGYGAGVARLAEELKVPTKKAAEIHKRYRENLPLLFNKVVEAEEHAELT